MTSLPPPLTISTLSRPSVSMSRRGGEREGTRDTLTHRVKDWDLVMCVAGRRGGGREGTRDTLTHSQGQGLGPSDVCGKEEGRRERGNERHTHSLTGSRIGT